MASLEAGRLGQETRGVTDAALDDEAFRRLTAFSLSVGIIDPEILREQLQEKRNGLLHPLADKAGEWLRGFQRRRRSPFTTT